LVLLVLPELLVLLALQELRALLELLVRQALPELDQQVQQELEHKALQEQLGLLEPLVQEEQHH
jgi:hypothetical protein